MKMRCCRSNAPRTYRSTCSSRALASSSRAVLGTGCSRRCDSSRAGHSSVRWTRFKSILLRLSQWASYSPYEPAGQLSEREREVLKLVATGCSNRDIAQQLFLSEGTIKAHVSHIMTKVGVERRGELIRYALGNGVSPD